MKKKGIIGVSAVIIICFVLILGISIWRNHDTEQETLADNNTELNVETEVPQTEENKVKKVRLMMVGDNLLHMGIVRSGQQSDGTKNYDVLFEPLKEHLAYADIRMINQETIFGGNHLGFSGFPHFNSPTEVGDAIAKAGFNIVLHASNHSADQGINGINHCIDFWENYPEVHMTGIYKEVEEDNQDIEIIQVEGVSFAILNYTYSPNLSTLPKDIQGHLGMLCDWDENSGKISYTRLHPDVITDISVAKQMADVVIVCPHWGTEYTFVPSSYQKKFAQQMTEAGADLIIGTHPHVIQPVEWIVGENGNKALCFYSLGNYVSTQQNPQSMLEAMAWVTFIVDENSVQILKEETGAIPMVCHYTSGPVRLERVYFLDEYTQEKAQSHGIHSFNGEEYTLDNLLLWSEEVLGEWTISSNSVFLFD